MFVLCSHSSGAQRISVYAACASRRPSEPPSNRCSCLSSEWTNPAACGSALRQPEGGAAPAQTGSVSPRRCKGKSLAGPSASRLNRLFPERIVCGSGLTQFRVTHTQLNDLLSSGGVQSQRAAPDISQPPPPDTVHHQIESGNGFCSCEKLAPPVNDELPLSCRQFNKNKFRPKYKSSCEYKSSKQIKKDL